MGYDFNNISQHTDNIIPDINDEKYQVELVNAVMLRYHKELLNTIKQDTSYPTWDPYNIKKFIGYDQSTSQLLVNSGFLNPSYNSYYKRLMYLADKDCNNIVSDSWFNSSIFPQGYTLMDNTINIASKLFDKPFITHRKQQDSVLPAYIIHADELIFALTLDYWISKPYIGKLISIDCSFMSYPSPEEVKEETDNWVFNIIPWIKQHPEICSIYTLSRGFITALASMFGINYSSVTVFAYSIFYKLSLTNQIKILEYLIPGHNYNELHAWNIMMELVKIHNVKRSVSGGIYGSYDTDPLRMIQDSIVLTDVITFKQFGIK